MRVLAGPAGLAIGINCEDPDPSGIVSFSVRRDAPLLSEDDVRVVLGTFLDGRSGYMFAVNPSGARYDGLINPGGERDNAEWDGIWEAAATRLPNGWSAEILIPIQTLSFKPGCRSDKQTLAGARLRVDLSPDLSIASYVQYDTDTGSIGTNSRLRWTFLPVADLLSSTTTTFDRFSIGGSSIRISFSSRSNTRGACDGAICEAAP